MEILPKGVPLSCYINNLQITGANEYAANDISNNELIQKYFLTERWDSFKEILSQVSSKYNFLIDNSAYLSNILRLDEILADYTIEDIIKFVYNTDSHNIKDIIIQYVSSLDNTSDHDDLMSSLPVIGDTHNEPSGDIFD